MTIWAHDGVLWHVKVHERTRNTACGGVIPVINRWSDNPKGLLCPVCDALVNVKKERVR